MTREPEASSARPLPYVLVLFLQLIGIMVMGTVTATPLLVVWRFLRVSVWMCLSSLMPSIHGLDADHEAHGVHTSVH